MIYIFCTYTSTTYLTYDLHLSREFKNMRIQEYEIVSTYILIKPYINNIYKSIAYLKIFLPDKYVKKSS